MKAMILAAGLGTRLRPLTLERAKPAVPLLGKPLIVRLIERLAEEGVTDVRVNLHHLADTVEAAVERADLRGVRASFAFEPDIQGTAGGLKNNEAFFDNETFLMANADIVADFPLRDAIAFHRREGAAATLILVPQRSPFPFYPVRIDEEGRLLNFKNAPQSGGPPRAETYVFTGVHVIEPEVFDSIPPGRFYEINDQVYPEILRRGGTIRGFPVEGYWNDVGNPARYLDAQRDVFERSTGTASALIASDVTVDPAATIGENVSIESGAIVKKNASIRDSIVWEDATVGSGVTVAHSIVGAGVAVKRDCVNRVLTRNGEIEIG